MDSCDTEYLIGFINDKVVAHVKLDEANHHDNFRELCDALYEEVCGAYGSLYRYLPYLVYAGTNEEARGEELVCGDDLWRNMEQTEHVWDSGTCVSDDIEDVFHFYIVASSDLEYLDSPEQELRDAAFAYMQDVGLC